MVTPKFQICYADNNNNIYTTSFFHIEINLASYIWEDEKTRARSWERMACCTEKKGRAKTGQQEKTHGCSEKLSPEKARRTTFYFTNFPDNFLAKHKLAAFLKRCPSQQKSTSLEKYLGLLVLLTSEIQRDLQSNWIISLLVEKKSWSTCTGSVGMIKLNPSLTQKNLIDLLLDKLNPLLLHYKPPPRPKRP